MHSLPSLIGSDDILSLTVDPSGCFVATGETGHRPKITVWDVTTMSTISVLHGAHKCGVHMLAFNAEVCFGPGVCTFVAMGCPRES